MLDDTHGGLKKAVRNLLFDCGTCRAGDTLLIVFETEEDGYYDPSLAQSVLFAAEELGLKAETYGVPFQRTVTDPDADLVTRMAAVDCTVFFARLGDQIRFRTKDASMRQIISYALDQEMLSSPFGTVSYTAFDRLKQLVNDAFSTAHDVHVTCPAGTDFRGQLLDPLEATGDVTRKRFPVSIFAPIPSRNFKGRIAQNGFLTGCGSNYYDPYTCELNETLFVDFDDNEIVGFEGTPNDVAAARAHYEFVGDMFNIDTFFVHSWHIGIHPGCHYPQPASSHFERWGGGAFGNPRLLHFHTCGAYPPGEISLNVLDPTVRLDGVSVWRDGYFNPNLIAGGTALLESVLEMRALFDAPSRAVGLGQDNQLSYI